MTEIDQLDREILNALQQNATLGPQELAEICNASPSSCYRRVKRLRESGIIAREIALIDARFSPRPVTVVFEVVLEHQEFARQQSFKDKARDHEAISQCYLVAGEVDYLLVANFADLTAYYAFATEFLMQDPNIRNFRSLFVAERTKFEVATLF